MTRIRTRRTIDQIAGGAFSLKCPLWTYILAEAARTRTPVKIPVNGDQTISTPKLGPVGGRIVAEVFLGLMFGDPHSMLSSNPNWTPNAGANYKLRDSLGSPWDRRVASSVTSGAAGSCE